MKNIASALAAHLAQECTTLAYLVKLTRADGIVLGFTSHDRDLTVAGVLYRADGAFNPSALLSTTQLAPDNLTITGMVSASAITAADIAAGRYDQARCDVYVCNWADISQGVLQLRRGWIGTVKQESGRYSAVLHGLHDRLQQEIGTYYTAGCRHELGDAACGVALAPLSVTGSVTATLSAQQFYDTAQGAVDGQFSDGTLTWLSGANSGLVQEVQHWDAATRQMTLWLPAVASIQSGDAYRVTAGCDKRFTTCRTKFGNGLNFGGFPHLPGVDKILAYPDSKV